MSVAPQAPEASPEFARAAAPLEPGTHRVWSLIVTVFGDLAREEGAEIDGAALGRIVAAMGVKPEAMRVALHRLRKERWIGSRKAGRGAVHALSPEGRRQSAAAAMRIYAPERNDTGPWYLTTGDGLELTPGLRLGRAAPEGEAFGALLDLGAVQVPGWLRDKICPEELLAEALALEAALQRVEAALPVGGLGAVEVAALRGLIVHSWRRVLLRSPDVPLVFYPEDWPELRCRALVGRLLGALGRPDLAEL